MFTTFAAGPSCNAPSDLRTAFICLFAVVAALVIGCLGAMVVLHLRRPGMAPPLRWYPSNRHGRHPKALHDALYGEPRPRDERRPT